MAKLTLTDLATLTNETSALATINANNTLIENAIENTVLRDGSSPDTMLSDLDLNGFRILNLPTPVSMTEPARLSDIDALVGTTVTITAEMPISTYTTVTPVTGDLLAFADISDSNTNRKATVTSMATAMGAAGIPVVAGGTAVGSSLELKSTTATGTTDYIKATVGTNGATESFRVVNTGQLIKGHTATVESGSGIAPAIQNHGTATTGNAHVANSMWSNSTSGPSINLNKSRSGTIGTHTVVTSGDTVGNIIFKGSDGTAFIPAAAIQGQSDGTPGTNDMPGRLVFSTTLDGAAAVTEAMRIDNQQQVGIGVTPTASTAKLQIGAGTATYAPILLTSGTNRTSAAAGAVEYDGVQVYGTIDTSSGRGAVPVEQYYHLTAAGSTISTIANYFGATSNISLVASAYYIIDVYCWFLNTTSGTVVWTLTNSAAPTSQNIYYEMSPAAGIVAPPGTATMLIGQVYNDATAAKALAATAALTDAVNHYMHMKIFLQNGTGTSLKIQATKSAGTITPGINSYWVCRRMSPSNIGTFAA